MKLTERRPRKSGGKPVAIGAWPTSARSPEQIASDVEYVGSSEHKDYANPVNGEAPQQRSDKARCEKYPKEQWMQFTALLRAAIRLRCTSAEFDPDPTRELTDGWPRYVWGWFDGRLFQARHRTDPPGNKYKAWIVDLEEHPEDPEQRLEALRARSEESGA